MSVQLHISARTVPVGLQVYEELVPLTEGGGRGAVVEGSGTMFGESSTGGEVVSTEMYEMWFQV